MEGTLQQMKTGIPGCHEPLPAPGPGLVVAVRAGDFSQEIQLMEHDPGALGYGTEGVVGYMNRQAGLLGDQLVDSAQ